MRAEAAACVGQARPAVVESTIDEQTDVLFNVAPSCS
jgi:hypothetical protein